MREQTLIREKISMRWRIVVFIVVYGLVGACVVFAISEISRLPTIVVSLLIGFVGIRIADRVGQGFGIPPIFGRTREPVESTKSPPSGL